MDCKTGHGSHGDFRGRSVKVFSIALNNAKLATTGTKWRKAMCEALRTLMKDEIDKEIAEATAKAIAEATAKATAEATAKATAEAIEKEHKASIEKLAASYIETGTAKTKKEAVKLAKAILG